MDSRSAFTVLTRLADRKPEQGFRLREALHGRLDACLDAAVDVATQTAGPLDGILAELLREGDFADACGRVHDRVPPVTAGLVEAAVELTRQCLDAEVARHGDTERAARLRLNLVTRLCHAGRATEAVTVARDAVSCAEAIGAEPLFRAWCLDALAMALHEVDASEQAAEPRRQAERILRELFQESPEMAAHDLARVLGNLAALPEHVVAPEEALAAAEESLALRRRFSASKTRAAIAVADTLVVYSAALSALGRHEDARCAAEEAAITYRDWAEAEPDASERGLATALRSLAASCLELGQAAEALAAASEALPLARSLARRNPDAFNLDLRISLRWVGRTLLFAGRPEEAIAALQESLQIPSERSPMRNLTETAQEREVLARALRRVSRMGEAADAMGAAVAAARELAARSSHPARRLELARMLNNLAIFCGESGDQGSRLAPAREAVDLYRGLAAGGSVATVSAFAVALDTLSRAHRGSGAPRDALATGREAVAAIASVFAKQPEDLLQRAVAIRDHYVEVAAECDEVDEALVVGLDAEVEPFLAPAQVHA